MAMKQIFDWLREQIDYEREPEYNIADKAFNEGLSVAISKINEAEAKWEAEDIPIIHGEAELELHDKVVRAKAIDEFVSAIEEYYFEVEDSKFRPYLKGINLVSEFNIRKIAEQLKEE